MVRWLRWHCPPDTGFEIRALAVWGRARYLSVTEAPHNTNFHTWMGKKHFCFFQTAETGNRAPNSGVKGSGANHYPRAPALLCNSLVYWHILMLFATQDTYSPQYLLYWHYKMYIQLEYIYVYLYLQYSSRSVMVAYTAIKLIDRCIAHSTSSFQSIFYKIYHYVFYLP